MVLKFIEKRIEFPETGFPMLTVVFDPEVGFGERLGDQTARTALGVASLRDKASTFENTKMFGDGGLAHGEGAGKIVDGGFAAGEGGENSAAGGVGERGENGVERRGAPPCITMWFHNRMVL